MSNVALVKGMLSKNDIKNRFEQILGKKAQGFISSVVNCVSNDKLLANADPKTVLGSAVNAATLDLPIDPNLGFAYIVPYKGQAQFQMGYRGYVQLALRTGQYTRMNCIKVYDNQFKGFNTLTEELDADFSTRGQGEVIGYAFYFKMINGFEKTAFEYKETLMEHGKRYSQSFNSKYSPWKSHEDEMCMKTLTKQTLKRFGILSIEMQSAIEKDQAVIKEDGETEYVDGVDFQVENDIEKSPFQVDLETGEVIENA